MEISIYHDIATCEEKRTFDNRCAVGYSYMVTSSKSKSIKLANRQASSQTEKK